MSPDPRDPTETPVRAARQWAQLVALATLLVGAALTAGLLSACLRRGPDDSPPAGSGGGGAAWSSAPLPPKLFRDWPAGKKPDVALILTGQQQSYLKFCGCSTPQLGGFERRFNFMAKLRAMGWPLVAADLGDLVQFKKDEIHDQAILKYRIAMQALETLGYVAIGLGLDDFLLPIDKGIGEVTLQKPDGFPRILAANLAQKEIGFPHPEDPKRSMIRDWQQTGGKNGVPMVGVVGIVGRSVIQALEDQHAPYKFAANAEVLKAVLAQMQAARIEIKCLLFQGSFRDAQIIAQTAFPNTFDVILCLSEEDTPPAQATVVGTTMIVRVGHKGKFIGVVGAFRTGNAQKPFELHYESVQMGEEYETDEGKEANHPVLKLLDQYAQDVKAQNFLARTPKRPAPLAAVLADLNLKPPPSYVGSGTCVNCHQHAADAVVWQKSKHSHAYEALSKKASKPAMRQYDPECISCHVVGYSHPGGFVSNAATLNMKNVGCESCHGPGSAHAGAPNDKRYQLAMSPWKGTDPTDRLPDVATLQKGFNAMTPQQQTLVNRINSDMCQKCHDPENDPHWKFETYWPQVMHGKTAAKVANVQPAAAAQNKP